MKNGDLPYFRVWLPEGMGYEFWMTGWWYTYLTPLKNMKVRTFGWWNSHWKNVQHQPAGIFMGVPKMRYKWRYGTVPQSGWFKKVDNPGIKWMRHGGILVSPFYEAALFVFGIGCKMCHAYASLWCWIPSWPLRLIFGFIYKALHQQFAGYSEMIADCRSSDEVTWRFMALTTVFIPLGDFMMFMGVLINFIHLAYTYPLILYIYSQICACVCVYIYIFTYIFIYSYVCFSIPFSSPKNPMGVMEKQPLHFVASFASPRSEVMKR